MYAFTGSAFNVQGYLSVGFTGSELNTARATAGEVQGCFFMRSHLSRHWWDSALSLFIEPWSPWAPPKAGKPLNPEPLNL